MTVFLQAKFGEVINPNVFAAYWGFSQRGFETRKFESIKDLTLTSTDIVCGNIGVVQAGLEKIGIDFPMPIDIPNELLSFCKRKIYNSTIQEIHRTEKWPLFIKPKNTHKLFNGHVISHERDLIYTSTIPDDCEVIVSEVLDFQSEYRVFVLDAKLLGARCYHGDCRKIVDFETVERMVAAYKSSPIAYSIDVALTKEGDTVLIEVNDAFSLGTYGLDPILYSKMIEARWGELVERA